jgi:CheY-like chemotaxis protein
LLQHSKNFLVTAYGREISLDQASSKLVDSLIVKPVNPSNLLDAIMNSFGIEHVSREQPINQLEKPFFKGETILLVEDNEVNQEVAIGLLSGTNLNVLTAENGQQAIQMLEQHSIDLVLMDMQMPVLDGVSATEQIRLNPNWQQLPIIAMTANAMKSDVERCLNAGMNSHLAKPINVHNLYKTLSQYLLPNDEPSSTPQPATSSSAPNDNSDLPHLSGINLEQAIFDIGGDKESYFSILSRFLTSQLEELPMFKEVIEKEDWDMAARMAHSLKGSSANLGIALLSKLAAKMERSIKEHSKTALGELDVSTAIIEKLHQELSLWQEKSQQQLQKQLTDPIELYQRLVTLVDEYDVEALAIIQGAEQFGVWTEAQQSQLVDAIEGFEFELAKELLNQLPKP